MWTALLSRLRSLFRRSAAERDLDAELQDHLAHQIQWHIEHGLPADRARRQALVDLGGREQLKEECRDERGVPWLENLWRDVIHAIRMFRRQPLFSLGVVLILALGIGLVTSVVSLVNAQYFRPWQVPDPGSIAVIAARPNGTDYATSNAPGISIAEFRYLHDHSRTIRGISFSDHEDSPIADSAGHEFRVAAAFVSADYFDAFRVGMSLGRRFVAEDEDYGAPKAVAILSDDLWRERFGRDPTVIGREIHVGKRPFRVIGVAARGFADVDRGQYRTDMWLPLPALALRSTSPFDRASFNDPRGSFRQNSVAGRLRDGVTRAAASAELRMLSDQFRSAASLPSNHIAVVDTRPLNQYDEPLPPTQLRTYELLLFAASLVLLLACANVGNLLLARGVSRQREFAIQLSLGASRARVVRRVLIEAVVLSAVAGLLGFGLAFVVPRVMLDLGFRLGGSYGFYQITDETAANPVRTSFYAPDVVVFGFTMLLSGFTTVLAGLAPALRATRVDLAALSAERHGRTVGGARLRVSLLATQIALTTLLLMGAALLTRALGNTAGLSPGFPMANLQAVSIKMPWGMREPDIRFNAFLHGLNDSLETTDLWPVAFSLATPFEETNYVMTAHLPDEAAGVFHPVLLRPVSRNYFAVLGIPIVKGRAPDSDTDQRQLVVSEAAARMLWPRADPIGKTLMNPIGQSEFETCVVVGVAKDVAVRSMITIEPVIYRVQGLATTLLVRSASPHVADRIRAIATTLEPRVTISGRPYTAYAIEALSMAMLGSHIAWVLGGLGLVLAMVGAFGVFAYAVESRRREIGIRLALGADGGQIVLLMFRMANRALLWGLVGGFAMSIAATPVLHYLLYGLNPVDPLAYAEVIGILVVSVGLATWIPARRAVTVDPAVTLRFD